MAEVIVELDGVELGRALEFDPGTWGTEFTDALMPSGDLLVGADTLAPPLWSFLLQTDAGDAVGAREQLAQWAAAWKPASLGAARATSVLRYLLDGRWRRVYGRPRRFAPQGAGGADGGPMAAGRGRASCDFQLAHAATFDDVEQSVTLDSVPPTSGGLVPPLVAPLTTTMTGDPAARFLDVGGDAPAPLRVTFTGPISDPWVRVGGVEVGITGAIAFDQVVVVDARTGTVTGVSAGRLSRATRLTEARLDPGVHEVQYGGSGEATVTVAWRNTWRSL